MVQSRWKTARLYRLEAAILIQMGAQDASNTDPDAMLAAAMLKGSANAYAQIQRYLAAAERSYYRARNQLYVDQCQRRVRANIAKTEEWQQKFLERKAQMAADATAPPNRVRFGKTRITSPLPPPPAPPRPPFAPKPTPAADRFTPNRVACVANCESRVCDSATTARPNTAGSLRIRPAHCSESGAAAPGSPPSPDSCTAPCLPAPAAPCTGPPSPTAGRKRFA